MEKHEYGDKIFKLLQRMERDRDKPDLHSFKAETEKGTVFVEARSGEVRMDEHRENEVIPWVGSYMAAANRLEMLGLKLNTVEM